MIAEFKVSNYRSIKDEQTLSLIATTDEAKKNNSVKIDKFDILKSIAIYGPNASGKSNLIRAIECMLKFVRDSATSYKPNDKIPVTPFAFDKKCKEEPTSFEITVFINNIRYQYGFSATREKIHEEYLFSWPKGRAVLLFQRSCNDESPYFGAALKGNKKEVWSLVKDNMLFLSVAAKFNNEQLGEVYNWFVHQLINLYDFRIPFKLLTDTILMDEQDPMGLKQVVRKILLSSDLGFGDIVVAAKDNINTPDMPDDMPSEMKDAIIEGLSIARQTYHCNKKYVLDFEEESDGTKQFYRYIGSIMFAIEAGCLILKDELETNLHPILLRKIVELFNSSKSNAQIIFTTHETTLLDPELFSRDQIYFTEKDVETEQTKLYSLVEYNVRKDEAFQKRYLAGRYGALPIIERFDLIEEKR